MIVKTFDNGWGNQYPLKQFEQQVVGKALAAFESCDQKTVVINSVWYTDEFHEATLTWLRQNSWDRLVLIAMLDAAIPQPSWFKEFDRPVTAIGFYPGSGALDFCAMFFAHYCDTRLRPQDLDVTLIDTPFMCLMRKPHWHRRKLFKHLRRHGVLDLGFVTFGSENGQAFGNLPVDIDSDDLAPNAAVSHYGRPNDIVSLGHPNNWQRHFVNIVAETFYDTTQQYFVSEKIYKPIVGLKPFLVYDPQGAQPWLIEHGFEPYTQDFQDICDLDLSKPFNLGPFLGTLCRQTNVYWQHKYQKLMPKILYNQDNFWNHVKRQHQRLAQGFLQQ